LGPACGHVLHRIEPDDVSLVWLGPVPKSLSCPEPVSGPEPVPQATSEALLAHVVVRAMWNRQHVVQF
jgi:hypothetical protein